MGGLSGVRRGLSGSAAREIQSRAEGGNGQWSMANGVVANERNAAPRSLTADDRYIGLAVGEELGEIGVGGVALDQRVGDHRGGAV